MAAREAIRKHRHMASCGPSLPPSLDLRQQCDAARHNLSRRWTGKPEDAPEERWIGAKPVASGGSSSFRMEATLIDSSTIFIQALKTARRFNEKGEQESRATVLLELKRENVCACGALPLVLVNQCVP